MPKVKSKKKQKQKKSMPSTIKTKTKGEAGSEDPSVPDATSGSTAVAKYKQSGTLVTDTKEVKAQTAIASVKKDEYNNKPDAIEGVPIPANLPVLRRAIIDRARGELGKVEGTSVNPVQVINPATGKSIKLEVGFERLAEYNAVAFGANVGGWVSEQNLWNLVTVDIKHTTWCGIFALWAVKMGAGLAASDYSGALQAVLDTNPSLSPVFALFAAHFLPQPVGSFPDKQLYKNLQWDMDGGGGGGIFLLDNDSSLLLMDADVPNSKSASGVKHRLSPSHIVNWLNHKKSVPPIKPGDIGFTREGSTGHLYVIERILEVDGKYVPGYDPKNGTYPGRHVIESWFDIDAMPRDSNNPHK